MLFPRRIPAAGRSRRRHAERGRRRAVAMAFWPEELEARRLLSNVSWVGDGNDNLWSDPQNWSDDKVPGAAADVTIDRSGDFTIVYDATAGDTTIDSLNGSDALSISGGSLTIATTSTASPAPTSTLTGDLTIAGGSVVASGPQTSVTASGPVTATDGTLSAQGGADFMLPGLTSFNGTGMTFSAVGSGSTLDISGITSYGGTGTTIAETDGAELLMDTSFTTLDGVSFTIDGTSDLAGKLIDNLTSLTDGGLTVLGGTYAFQSLADIDGSSLDVENGASLTLTGVETETNSAGVNFGLPFYANGGSTLSLPSLTSATGDGINVWADGANSVINLTALTTFDVNPAGGALTASDRGTINLSPGLTSINGANISIDSTSTIAPLTQLTSITGGTLTDNGADLTSALANVASIDGLAILVEGGGKVSLPLVQGWTNNGYPYSESLQVQGTNSMLDLPNLATITGNGMSIQASGSGSVIDVSGLTSFGTYNGLLSVTQSGTVLDTGLTSLNNVTVQLDGTGTLAVSQWESLTNGGLTISGGDYAADGRRGDVVQRVHELERHRRFERERH